MVIFICIGALIHTGEKRISTFPPLSKKGVVNLAEMVRVNTRISKPVNDWLDQRSEETGVPKSTLIFLAIENYKKESDVMEMMGDMGSIMVKLDELEKAVQRNGAE